MPTPMVWTSGWNGPDSSNRAPRSDEVDTAMKLMLFGATQSLFPQLKCQDAEPTLIEHHARLVDMIREVVESLNLMPNSDEVDTMMKRAVLPNYPLLPGGLLRPLFAPSLDKISESKKRVRCHRSSMARVKVSRSTWTNFLSPTAIICSRLYSLLFLR